ncbi:hypothetical protein ACNOYE_22685 [Nannocystaceae bacterium ST9]
MNRGLGVKMRKRSAHIRPHFVLLGLFAACSDELPQTDSLRDIPQLCFYDDNLRWAECCEYGSTLIEGTSSAETLTGSGTNECLVGYEGADAVTGAGGDDRVFAGAGNDTITAGAGSHLVAGQSGDDTIDVTGSAATDTNTVHAGTGNDTVTGGDGADIIRGDEGSDELHGGDNVDRLYGGDGADDLYGDDHPDELHGGDGVDELQGGSGADSIWGNAGDDTLTGGGGGDLLVPGPGADAVYGGEGNDIIEIYDPCEIGEDSIIDGGNGTDTLRVPLPLNDPAMAELSVSNVENVEVREEDPFWIAGAECASPEPSEWEYDDPTALRWRYASAFERKANEWALGTVLVELDVYAIDHGNTTITFQTPSGGELVATEFDFDVQQSGVDFHELHIPGEPVSRTPVFRRFLEPMPVSAPGAWGWAILDDYGGIAGWVHDGDAGWRIGGSERTHTLEPFAFPSSNDMDVDDYLVFEPALMTPDLDVVAPSEPGEPYTGHLGGEGRFCTNNAENWMSEILQNVQSINQAMQEPVGPGVFFDLQYAYCNIFENQTIVDDSFPSGSKFFAADTVAKYCDAYSAEVGNSGDTVKETLESYSDYPSDDGNLKNYWGLHFIDCMDDDDHPYTFGGCGRNAYCYRDRIWEDAEHAALHISGSSVLLGHLVSSAPFTHPEDPPLEPWSGVFQNVWGAATYSEVGNACSGAPSTFQDGPCPGGGVSVATQSKVEAPLTRWTCAHEVGHNFDAHHDNSTTTDPPGCDTTYTIMAGDIVGDTGVCVAKEFSMTSLAEMADCLAEPECPREDPAP